VKWTDEEGGRGGGRKREKNGDSKGTKLHVCTSLTCTNESKHFLQKSFGFELFFSTCGLHYKIFMIVNYDCNDSAIIIYDRNDSDLYYKTEIVA
jgi:hypothetical protein